MAFALGKEAPLRPIRHSNLRARGVSATVLLRREIVPCVASLGTRAAAELRAQRAPRPRAMPHGCACRGRAGQLLTAQPPCALAGSCAHGEAAAQARSAAARTRARAQLPMLSRRSVRAPESERNERLLNALWSGSVEEWPAVPTAHLPSTQPAVRQPKGAQTCHVIARAMRSARTLRLWARRAPDYESTTCRRCQ
jgi:hypothetical protein